MSRVDNDRLSDETVRACEERAFAYRHAREWARHHAPVSLELAEDAAVQYAIWYEERYMEDPDYYGERSHSECWREYAD